MFNISSSVMRFGSIGEEGVSKVVKSVRTVGSQGEYIYVLGGFSRSGGIILAAIQLENNVLSII